MKKIKIVMISVIFYAVGIMTTFLMFKLWFWLFDSKSWKIIFILITLLGAMKYFWQHTEWTIKKLQNK